MLADNALTTLDRMKLMLGLADIEDERTDEIITLLINRASSWIERQIGRHLGRHSYHQWYDADGQQELVLLEYPIISVEYVKQEGKIVDPETYDYAQTGEIGVIYRDKGWLKAGYRRGLAYDIVAPMRVIEVSYTAGYVLPKDATADDPQTLPSDLEGLLWDMVSQIYTNFAERLSGPVFVLHLGRDLELRQVHPGIVETAHQPVQEVLICQILMPSSRTSYG